MILLSLKQMRFRDWFILFVIAALVATCGVFGTSYVLGEGWAAFDSTQTGLLIAAATVFFAIVLFFVDIAFVKIATPKTRRSKKAQAASNTKGAEVSSPAPAYIKGALNKDESLAVPSQKSKKPKKKRSARQIFAKITPRWRAKSIILFAAIMLVFWLPWYIANLPGTTYWDTYYQIYMLYPESHPISIIPFFGHADNTVTDAWLTDHHPVLTTLIYGAFGLASDALTGNWMAGVFAFTTIQTLIFVVEFSACVAYMRARNCPLWLCFAVYVFFAIAPFVSTWAMCMVKDSMFSMFYIPYFLMMFEAVRTRGETFCRPKTFIFFALCALMLCLTRKTGLFIVVPVTIFGMWLCRPRKIREAWVGEDFKWWASWMQDYDPQLVSYIRKKSKLPMLCYLTQGLVCIAIAGALLPLVVFPAFNIAPGGKQEALGPMFQQTARFMVENRSEGVTTDEYYIIKEVIDYNKLFNEYTYDTQDKVKYHYILDATNEELLNYFKAYIKMGLRDPESYLAGIMSIAGRYVAPTDYLNIRMITVDTKIGDDQRQMLWNPGVLEPLRTGMDEAYKTVAQIPGLNFGLLTVTYVLWIPAMLLYTMLRRRIKCGILFVPLIVLIAFCVIAPLDDARYVAPIFDTIPLFVAGMVILLQKKLAEQKSQNLSFQYNVSYQNPRTVYVKLATTSTI